MSSITSIVAQCYNETTESHIHGTCDYDAEDAAYFIFYHIVYESMKHGSALLLSLDRRRHPQGGIGGLIGDLTFQVQSRL